MMHSDVVVAFAGQFSDWKELISMGVISQHINKHLITRGGGEP
jgi:malonyl CoA-acyl carrier protein transacylase